ncbi:MAG: hypothetical protein WDZ59_03140 [Pirellulales bacterium]
MKIDSARALVRVEGIEANDDFTFASVWLQRVSDAQHVIEHQLNHRNAL